MKVTRLAAVVLLLTGCSDADDPSQAIPTFRLEEVARYGSVDEEGAALTRVAGVAVADSTILMLESAPPRVAIFGQDGSWLRDVGRAGDGPGEFRRPSHIGLADGRVWVGDPSGGRLEVFGPEYTPVASYRWDLATDSLDTRAVPTILLSDGSILAGPGSLNIGAAVRGSLRYRSYLRATTAGEPTELLYREVLDPTDFLSAEIEAGTYERRPS